MCFYFVCSSKFVIRSRDVFYNIPITEKQHLENLLDLESSWVQKVYYISRAELEVKLLLRFVTLRVKYLKKEINSKFGDH